MLYTEITPPGALAPYIDAYWSVKGTGKDTIANTILPDGCVDIIFNLGEDAGDMKSGKAYLIGAMTGPIQSPVAQETRLLGVRFRPVAFFAFYDFSSLHEITDDSVECEKALTPDLSFLKHPAEALNKFFLDRLTRPKHRLFPLLEDIRLRHGQVRVEELAKRHFITVRQLERDFRYYVGLSPKEFMKQERFRHALRRVRRRLAGESLSDIAHACGFYDHSHLAHEIKRYTGEVPASLAC
ncbi:MAG TPA: DUF6597 domain-containing transcriptional factor [Puia sp.]|jgi:AraC-like DNA-binding protein